ncbi:MAG: hypothetical protein HYV24_00195 [Deltaproteobacteria bacterium]|nr:hypothetical protein [Deltaproteobacteria bacterium]
MKRFGNEGGFSRLKTLFWVSFFGLSIYGAWVVAPPWLAFWMLKTEIEDEAKIAHMYSNQALQKRILTKAHAWSVPINEDNLEIVRGRDFISIQADYTVTFTFFNSYEKQQRFYIDVSKPLKDASGVL